MVIDENELLNILSNHKCVTLLEPQYKRKYPPLGLAKIATFLSNNNISWKYQRDYEPHNDTLICITTLFTYESEKVFDSINQVLFLNPKAEIVLGGIFASLMPNLINERYPSVKIFVGYSKSLDSYIPTYDNFPVEQPWDNYSFVFTTRGCPNRCKYCAVHKLEPDIWINPTWKQHIDLSKPCVMISDNNLSAQTEEHINNICSYLLENERRVIFDNGFDCKYITPESAKVLSKLKYERAGLRLAFDRIEEDGIFQNAIKLLINSGVRKSDIMAYVLFNFEDTPQEAIYRMEECIKLGIRPYPQQYTPLNKLNRKPPFISKLWTPRLIRTFRFFYLMQGFYTKIRFIDWLKLPMDKHQMYELQDSDWEYLIDTNLEEATKKLPQAQRIISIDGQSISLGAYGGEGGAKTGLYSVPIAIRTGDRPKDKNGKPQLLPIGYRRIRRLTPIECERLQGFPDNFTKYGVDQKGNHINISDTQRYKCLGNAVTTNVIKAIGEQLLESLGKDLK